MAMTRKKGARKPVRKAPGNSIENASTVSPVAPPNTTNGGYGGSRPTKRTSAVTSGGGSFGQK
jgi:hypothetical protein